MKKTKILLPLTAIAAIGTTAPCVALASCNKGGTQVTVKSITAELADPTKEYFVGETLTKSDIVVYAKKSDGTKVKVDDWKCDDITGAGYHFSDDTEKTFTITYAEKTATITITPAYYGFLTFEMLLPLELVVDTTSGSEFATETVLHVYGAKTAESEDLHEIPLSDLDITVATPATATYNKTNGTLKAVAAGTTNVTAHYKGLPASETSYDATMTVTVTAATSGTITKAEAESTYKGAKLTLAKGDTDNMLNVPEYVVVGTGTSAKEYPVTSIAAPNAAISTVETLILPNSIKEIAGGMFAMPATPTISDVPLYNIIYKGTENQWANVKQGEDWAGFASTGVWCYDDENEQPTFVNFARNHDCEYDAKTHTFTSETITSIIAKNSHIVGFDMNLTYEESTKVTYHTIEIKNSGLAAGYLEVDDVYVDGIKKVEGTDYTIEGGRHDTKIKFVVSKEPTTENHFVWVKFRSPLLTASSVSVTMTGTAA